VNKVEGRIAYYKLEEWWFSTFDENERIYIDSRYQPMGLQPHSLTRGRVIELRQPVTEFLNGLNTWFRSSNDGTIAERIHYKLTELGREDPIVGPGYYDGRHFTTYVRDFEILKKNGNSTELEKLLLELVNATESENAVDNMGVAPAYYSELAIHYRKQKEYSKEVSILERYAKQKHAPGVMPEKLMERLVKARKLLASSV
jgi:hypothetical protein